MPEQGLLVVRELCDPRHDESPADWFQQDAVSWLLPDRYPDEPVLVPTPTVEGTHALVEGANYPPASLQRFLSRLSADTTSVVSLYFACHWGGDLEPVPDRLIALTRPVR